MHCLPPTGLSSGTVSLFWLAVFLTTVGALVLVLSRRRAAGPLAALVLVGIAVASVGISAPPADAAPIVDGCTPTATSAPTTGAPTIVAPETSTTTATTVPTTALPTTTVPATVPVTVPPTTIPPLGACGPAVLLLSFAPTGLGQGELLLEPGVPWLLPVGWSITGGASLEVEVGLQVELAQGVPGPILPVLLVPFTSVPGTITALPERVEVDLDVATLRDQVEADVAAYLLATDPAEPYTLVVDVRLSFTLTHDGACPDQRVMAPVDGVLGSF